MAQWSPPGAARPASRRICAAAIPTRHRACTLATLMTEPSTVPAVFRALATDPWSMLGRRWNYKSAVLSSLTRATVFFSVNLSSGLDGAQSAAATEFVFRLVTSGFYGALTQSFRRVEPRWQGQLAAMLVLPAVGHSLELLVHWLRGTPELAASIGASVMFTTLSTAFHLFAMQRGVLIVGDGQRSLREDLVSLPRIMAAFVAHAMRSCLRTSL